MSCSTEDENYGAFDGDEEELDVLSEVKRNTVIKLYSRETAAQLLFGKNRDQETVFVDEKDLALIGPTEGDEEKPRKKNLIGSSSSPVSSRSNTWHGRSVVANKCSVSDVSSSALAILHSGKGFEHSRQGVEHETDYGAPAESTGSTETAALQDSKKMAFERMIQQHVLPKSETQKPAE